MVPLRGYRNWLSSPLLLVWRECAGYSRQTHLQPPQTCILRGIREGIMTIDSRCTHRGGEHDVGCMGNRHYVSLGEA